MTRRNTRSALNAHWKAIDAGVCWLGCAPRRLKELKKQSELEWMELESKEHDETKEGKGRNILALQAQKLARKLDERALELVSPPPCTHADTHARTHTHTHTRTHTHRPFPAIVAPWLIQVWMGVRFMPSVLL
jgi:hypothetical protein